MHIKPQAPFDYYTDWTLVASGGATIVRTDNNLIYNKADSTVVTLVEDGNILISDYRIDDVFLIAEMQGSFTNVNLFYRHFDIRDLDQRIGLVSELLTADKSSVVHAINSLKGYVDGILESSEVEGSPYASYADFLADAGATITPSKYAYVTFTDTDTWPVGGNWDKIVAGETWRLDCSATAWSPTSNMTASSTSNVLDEAATNALKTAGSDTVTAWLQSFRNNLKSLFASVSKTYMIVPDYVNMEDSKINSVGGSWTVTKSGYVRLDGRYHSGGNFLAWSINENVVARINNEMSVSQGWYHTIIPVAAGDVVRCNQGDGEIRCYFIPPKKVEITGL
jgi:hypothetical protein